MKRIGSRIRILLVVVIVCALAGILWLFWGTSLTETETEVKGNSVFAEAQRLAGQWIRPDGGYRLVIEDVAADGSLEVSYYNPHKINVHVANWKLEEGKVHIFVELKDINYPGSKYSLIYAKENNVLEGKYFQAVQKQTFNVIFVRKN